VLGDRTIGKGSVVADAAVIVFREGLEAVLILRAALVDLVLVLAIVFRLQTVLLFEPALVVGLLAIEVGLLPPHAVVADLVYVPLRTPLLAAAQALGLKTADGLGMLLHQAVRGFELWFGQRPEVTPELRALVEDDLTKS